MCVFFFCCFFGLWFLFTSLVIVLAVLIHPPFLSHLDNCVKGDRSRGEAREEIFLLFLLVHLQVGEGGGH